MLLSGEWKANAGAAIDVVIAKQTGKPKTTRTQIAENKKRLTI